jgi:methionyl-tRNA formyltransferase
MVVVAYGLILPQSVLDVPRLGCVNIHGSLLPRWRGAAPIQRAVLAGDAASGVSIMRMDAGLDTGPVLLMRSIDLTAHETSSTLHDKLATLGAESLLEALDGLAAGTLAAQPQPAEGATYAAKLRKEEALIDWSQPAVAVDRLVRGLNPWPTAETRVHGQQLKIWEGTPVAITTAQTPGTILSAGTPGLMIATGYQVLNVTRVQLAGRKAVSAGDFANAHSVLGVVLGTT